MNEGLDPKAPRRKRVSRACDRCRSKKDKCDGIRPTCSACQASGQTCSYDPNAKKRGLPEGYVRGLEKLWALSMCNIEGLEDMMLTLLGATAESAGRRERLLKLWTDDSASDSLHEVWKTSRLWGALEKMLSTSDSNPAQSPLKRPRDEDDCSSTSQWGFRVGRGPTPSGIDGPRVVGPHSSPGVKRARLSSSLSDSHRSPASSASTDASSLQLPPHAPRLLEAYFSRTHPWFPIIAKHSILRAFHQYGNGPLLVGKSSTGSGDHAALWAILSYTTAQGPSDPSENGSGIQDGSGGALAKAKEFYSIARGLIPSEKERFDLGHIQALLLLTLVNVGLEDWTAAWLLSGQSARMAEAVELGKLADTRRSDELQQRKAVFLGCFIIDSLLSVRLSRFPCMRAESLALVGRLEEDGLEEWNPWMDVLPQNLPPQGSNPPHRGPLLALSCFNRLVELAGVLNKIGRDFSQAANAHVFAQQILVDLKPWDDRLPPGCRLIGPESNYPDRHPSLLPHQTYLYITYAATLLFLYTRQLGQEQTLHGAPRTALDGTKKILYRTLAVLSQHVENFHTCGIPPLFEFPLRSIFESVSAARPKLESDGFSVAQWVGMFSRKLTEFGSSWPVFGSLTAAVENSVFSTPSPASSFLHQIPRKSSVSAASMSGGTYTSLRGEPKPISFAADRAGRNPADAHVKRPDPVPSVNDVASNYASKIRGLAIAADGFYTPQDSAEASGLSSIGGTNSERSAGTSTILLDKLLSSKGSTDSNLGLMRQQQPRTPESAMSSAMLQSGASNSTERFANNAGEGLPLNARRSYMPDESPASSNDIDSIFKELAYLDTYEWANSREEGLREFGFIDDNTFQAFCHDPDRLVGSQPLVPPTTSIADIWPPPGFFPETFQANNKESSD
ncbi:hypothetical protein VTN77DRAFT_5905 [Rasamsonia byssochlamydoides]|uniref:uncharacterized protein n=1 Tax=Rasamsonia byssochlamydoides TaxID=89139 RepID=UPI00374205C9